MKKSAFFALAAFAAAAAFAQPVVGTLSNVNGLVTVSQNNAIVSAGNGTTVVDGARIVSTATGNVTMQVNGCSVSLAPNQAITVDSTQSCQSMQAAVQNLTPPATQAGAGGAVGGSFAGGVGAGLGVALFGATVLYKAYQDTPASLR
ncbi:MAG: hypothetical protein EOO28_27450 [Comamonadaceae bacterium]|nr:MAG: hypothetical protein EOO28_27450 [Comamonadaceae bacterium]